MSFTIKTKGINSILNKAKSLDKKIDKPTFNEIGKLIADRIRLKTRTGTSMATDSKLKPLAQSTKKSRQSFARNHQTGLGFRPNKSNLTLSGQLLDSVTHKVNIQDQSVLVTPDGKRSPYGRERSVPDNKKVAEYVSEERPFMGLDDTGIKRVVAILAKRIRELILK